MATLSNTKTVRLIAILKLVLISFAVGSISSLGFALTPEEHKSSGVSKFSASDIVQQQVDAYNARDIDAFMATYSDNIAIYYLVEGEKKLSMEGTDVMKKEYGKLFETYTKLNCVILSREILDKNTIKDLEEVTGIGEKPLKLFATYTVKNGKINQVVFSDN